jgi:hypothetical protein
VDLIRKGTQNNKIEAGDMAQWYSTCLACTRPSVPFTVSPKKTTKKS